MSIKKTNPYVEKLQDANKRDDEKGIKKYYALWKSYNLKLLEANDG